MTEDFRQGEQAPGVDGSQLLFWLKAAAGAKSADPSPSLAIRAPQTAQHALFVTALTSAGASLVALDSDARLPRLVVNGEAP